MYEKYCQQCKAKMPVQWAGGRRWDAKHCSDACKQKAYRIRSGQQKKTAKKKTRKRKK